MAKIVKFNQVNIDLFIHSISELGAQSLGTEYMQSVSDDGT